MIEDRYGSRIRQFISSDAGFPLNAKSLSLNLSDYWKKHKISGPVDVIDFFSGCGGMSAGFQALNAIIPSYRIALAVDIDRDANDSYEANIGVRPKSIDVAALANGTANALAF